MESSVRPVAVYFLIITIFLEHGTICDIVITQKLFAGWIINVTYSGGLPLKFTGIECGSRQLIDGFDTNAELFFTTNPVDFSLW